MEQSEQHVPVLPVPVMEYLAPSEGEVVLDLTVGLGGHAGMMSKAVKTEGLILGLDVDQQNLTTAESRLTECDAPFRLFQANFSEFDSVLLEAGIQKVDVILADLGVCSTQLDNPERGFSFQQDGLLDMRMDDRLRDSAADLVNRMKESDLADLLYLYSQERFSRKIARRICDVRRDGRIKTTGELVKIICDALRVNPDSRKSKIHPATRTFQALRIAVNDEIGVLERLLEKAPAFLKPGGRIGIIAFHSIEDAVVKKDFNRRRQDGIYEILTKRPLIAESDERDANPRSRSAKFRAARRM